MYIGAVAVLPTYALLHLSDHRAAFDVSRNLSRLLQESKGVKQALREVRGLTCSLDGMITISLNTDGIPISSQFGAMAFGVACMFLVA